MWNPFAPTGLTEKIYQNFVDTGYVPEHIIKLLADKIASSKTLTAKEMAVYVEHAARVEDVIKSLTTPE